MSRYEVRLGSALMTLTDPDRGAEIAFNRWYERDHFYGGAVLGPGVLAGARFLARDTEKMMRIVPEGDDPDRGTMLALYWLADNGGDYWRWCTGNVNLLAVQGRMTAPGQVRDMRWLPAPWAESAAVDGVPAALALDRRFPAVVVSIVESEARTAEDLDTAYREECARSLCSEPGVALVIGASPQVIDLRTGPTPGARAETAAVWFFEDQLRLAAFIDAHEKAVADLGEARTVWLSPFVATVPGTDTHLDRLWL
ncbi:hypothetical protein GCM10009547_01610 [Sporichthya brevicatena]|jgi:hypothetical protein|uniref:Uncharacterized protein n=1 Tax=Sporichthya brevicatena TaxID=171442 RepID=A0ABP3RAB7_9ACTN